MRGAGDKPKKPIGPKFCFRHEEGELQQFREAARAEGFSNVSAWVLWHLRKAIREGRGGEKEK